MNFRLREDQSWLPRNTFNDEVLPLYHVILNCKKCFQSAVVWLSGHGFYHVPPELRSVVRISPLALRRAQLLTVSGWCKYGCYLKSCESLRSSKAFSSFCRTSVCLNDGLALLAESSIVTRAYSICWILNMAVCQS